jgi:hypothetical protein
LRSLQLVQQALTCLLLVSGITAHVSPAEAASVHVNHREGTSHGFLVVRSADGQVLASGELVQTVSGDRVNSEMTLYFKDGSVYDETAVYSQDKDFRLLTHHLRRTGPSFPDADDQLIDTASGSVTTQSLKDGANKPEVHHMKLPDDLANGLIVTLLKNISADTEITVPMLAGSSKPRVVQLTMRSEGREEFSVEGRAISAIHYIVHTTIGGVAGAMASVLGKQPPDAHFWIVRGKAPTFVRASTPLYEGGPIWTVGLAPVSLSNHPPHEPRGSEAGSPPR